MSEFTPKKFYGIIVLSGLTDKCCIMPKRLAKDKQSSLFILSISDKEKGGVKHCLTPGANVMKTFTSVSYDFS